MTDSSPPRSSGPLRRRPSYRALSALPATPAGGGAVWFFCSPPAQEERAAGEPSGGHFLDACALCNLPLRRNQDIYMCRGNLPFCSEECRQEWIDIEETREEEEKASYRSIPVKAASGAGASSIFYVRAAGTVVAG